MEDGLELSDILVKDTPGYDFIVAREKYFSFYPMQAVIRKPTDFANKQSDIRQLREDILTKSPYTVRNIILINSHYLQSQIQGAKLTETWFLSLLGDFLESMQAHLDILLDNQLANHTYLENAPCAKLNKVAMPNCTNDNFYLAYHMICSVGTEVLLRVVIVFTTNICRLTVVGYTITS